MEEEQPKRRKSPDLTGPQQCTKVPPYRPGHWVKVKDFDGGELGCDLSGKIRRVKSLTASLSTPEQKRVIWRVHFDDGRCLECGLIERLATEREIPLAGRAR